MVVLPRAEQPPKMDGDFASKCWANAARVDGFVLLNQVVARAALSLQPALKAWEYGPALGLRTNPQGRFLPVEPTTALLTYDDRTLFVAFECRDREIVANVQQPDGPVWLDDCVELFLSPQATETQVFHIVVTARGTRFDEKFLSESTGPSRAADRALTGRRWDCKMNFITGRRKDGWWAEMAIPFASLDTKCPSQGGMWTANFARWNFPATLHGGVEFHDISTWSPADASAAEPFRFGRLYFGRGPAAVVTRLLPGLPGEGVNTAEIALQEIAGKGMSGQLILSTQTESGDLIETTSKDVTLEPHGVETVNLAYKIPPDTSACFLAATLLSEQQFVDSIEMPLSIETKALQWERVPGELLQGRPLRMWLKVNKGDVSVGMYGLRVELLRGLFTAAADIPRLEQQRVEVVLNTRHVEPGSYMLRARLLKDGKALAEDTRDIEILKGP